MNQVPVAVRRQSSGCAPDTAAMYGRRPDQFARATGRLLIIFAPILALLAAAVILALAAWAFEWLRAKFLVAAGGVGAAAGVLAMVLLYRQILERQTANRRLRSLDARASDIFESAMDPIITVDDGQRVVLFNAAAEKVFRWSRSAVLGQSLNKLIPERFHQGHSAHIERFGETGVTSRRMGSQAELMALRANGEEFPIEASISQHAEDGTKFYTVILRDVTERVRAEESLRRSREELLELGAVAHQAREQEKRRIARELHDDLAQALAALQMDVAWCAERLPPGQDAFVKKLAGMRTLLEGTVAATRRIASDLRPLMLDDLGLQPALEWLAEDFKQRTGVACGLSVDISELESQSPYPTAVFRIVQEALANVAKHARASNVDIAIEQRGAEVTVTVRDDGVGFSMGDPRKASSFGLVGLRERALLVGGDAFVTSAPGHGTQILVRFIPTPGRSDS